MSSLHSCTWGFASEGSRRAICSHPAAGKPASTSAPVNEFTLPFDLQIISLSKWVFSGCKFVYFLFLNFISYF